MSFLMISCRKATELIDKRHAVGLTSSEQFTLRIHTTICNACRRYEKQSVIIEGLLKNEIAPPAQKPGIPPDAAQHLVERILRTKK